MDWSWSITAIGSGSGGQTPPRHTGLGFNPYQDTLSWYRFWGTWSSRGVTLEATLSNSKLLPKEITPNCNSS